MTTNRPKTTRQRIIKTALELFLAHGIRATTTRAIADAAEVNEITIFRIFGSKEELATAVAAVAFCSPKLPALSELELTGNLRDDLQKLAVFVVERQALLSTLSKFCVANITNSPESRERLRLLHESFIEWLVEYFLPYTKESGSAAVSLALQFYDPMALRTFYEWFLNDTHKNDPAFFVQHAEFIAAALSKN